jgi:hypothetical protein
MAETEPRSGSSKAKATPSAKRRPCAKCKRGRAERFYVGPRGRVCATCRRSGRSTTTRAVRLEETYGITEAEYAALLAAQDGACAICRRKARYNLDVDHSHSAVSRGLSVRDSVRGLLCKLCNRRLLTAARDDVAVLLRAIEYLNHPPAQLWLTPLTDTSAIAEAE